MTPTRFPLVILGFALTCSVVMSNFTVDDELNVTSSEDNATEPTPTLSNIASSADNESATAANSTITTVLIVTTINTTSIPGTNSTNSDTNQTSATGAPSTTLKTGVSSSDAENPTTPKPSGTTAIMPTTTKSDKDTGVKPPVEQSSNSTGIIVLIVILILAAVFVAVCCWTRRRGRRYSVDPTSQADGANIPLSSVDPPAEPVPHNGLQTFESAESSSNEPEVKPEVQEEQKAEAVEPGAESAAPAPDGSGAQPKEAAAEQSPPAPVEPEETGGEGLASAGTSVTGANENNSNNAGLTARDLKGTNVFWDVPLHSPV